MADFVRGYRRVEFRRGLRLVRRFGPVVRDLPCHAGPGRQWYQLTRPLPGLELAPDHVRRAGPGGLSLRGSPAGRRQAGQLLRGGSRQTRPREHRHALAGQRDHGIVPGRRGGLLPRLHGQAEVAPAAQPVGVYSFWSFITAGNCAGFGSYPLWLAIYQRATRARRHRGGSGSSGSPARQARTTTTCSTGPRPSCTRGSSHSSRTWRQKCSQAGSTTAPTRSP